MVNTDFLIVSYLVGLFVDWIFQSQWQASNKSKWGKTDDKRKSFIAVLSHSTIYALFTNVLVYALVPGLKMNMTITYFILLISHMIIDTRIPVRFIMKLKGLTEDEINDYVSYGFMHVGIDHRLHEMVLIILSLWM